MGQRNHVLHGGADLPVERGNFEGERAGRCAVSCAKTAEPIEMPCRLRTRVGPRNHVLAGDMESPNAKALFLGEMICPGMSDDTAVSCAKMAEPIKMPFWLWTRVGPWNNVLQYMWVQVAPREGAIFRGKDVPGHA